MIWRIIRISNVLIVFSGNRSDFSEELSKFQVRCDSKAEDNNLWLQ